MSVFYEVPDLHWNLGNVRLWPRLCENSNFHMGLKINYHLNLNN